MMGGERLDISVRNAISTATPETSVRGIMLRIPIRCQTGFAKIQTVLSEIFKYQKKRIKISGLRSFSQVENPRVEKSRWSLTFNCCLK
jgi:hypothetical protein